MYKQPPPLSKQIKKLKGMANNVGLTLIVGDTTPLITLGIVQDNKNW